MMRSVFVVFLFMICMFICCSGADQPEFIEIETKLGRIRGVIKESFGTKRKYAAFRGIPYAKPPVGKLRFKPPKPYGAWGNKTLDATQYGAACIQIGTLYTTYGNDEDCLFVNIFVPLTVLKTGGSAVLFQVFGGAYLQGAGDDYLGGPDFLMNHDIIHCTLNHRLGILGFLSLNTKEVSGNQGLKDAELALKWFYDNIVSYGGDPKRITLTGGSSGGQVIDLLVFNEDTAQYVNGYIPMSGVVTVRTFQPERFIQELYDLAKSYNYPADDCKSLLKFLRWMPAENLTILTSGTARAASTEIKWAPVVEASNASDSFLSVSINKLYDIKKAYGIPAFYTFLNREHMGVMGNVSQLDNIHQLLDTFVSNPPFIKNGLFIKEYDQQVYEESLNDILHYYIGNATGNAELVDKYLKLNSDLDIIYQTKTEVLKRVERPNTTTYLMESFIDLRFNLVKLAFPTNYSGAGHGDDVCYVFHCSTFKEVYDDALAKKDTDPRSALSLRAIDYYTSLLTNFATNGTPIHNGYPTAVFDPVMRGALKFLRMSYNSSLSFDGVIDLEKLHYLDGFFDKIDNHFTDTDKITSLSSERCDKCKKSKKTCKKSKKSKNCGKCKKSKKSKKSKKAKIVGNARRVKKVRNAKNAEVSKVNKK